MALPPAKAGGAHAVSEPSIRVGIGGWIYEPWRDNFYPTGLAHERELEYASRQLTAIEINSTFYSAQKPATVAKWRDATPPGFVFSLKASRFATNRRVLAGAGESIERFLNSGIAELGPKLGPIVWQFAATKRFEADDFAAFLKLLPKKLGKLPLQHALDVRHESFRCLEYLKLARRHRAATVFNDPGDAIALGDITGGFVYNRVVVANGKLAKGFKAQALDELATRARTWRDGKVPADVPQIDHSSAAPAPPIPCEVFVFFVNGAKEKAPAAAMALLKRLA